VITVLVSTYDGKKYLKEQLESLYNQNCKDIKIIARDDTSTDSTLNVLQSYNIKILQSRENLGAKGSFIELLGYAVENTNSEYFMFCDQDDIWEKDKIEKTLNKMKEMEKRYEDIPLLVHTDLKVVDANLNNINDSFWDYEQIDPKINQFSRLLVQNTITGCTVMINKKLAQLCLPMPLDAIMHDWWIGLVASQFGKIGYVEGSTIKYRQHRNNVIGSKGFTYVEIINKIFKAKHKIKIKAYIKQAKAFLDTYRDKLDDETITMLEDFSSIEQKIFWQKRKILLKHKVLKQGIIRNIGLFLKI
jgi:glycosyltransferase involved in cell wall biosynthesis